MNRIFLILLIFIFFSCGTQKQLQKIYTGKPETLLSKKFGNPKTIIEQENGKIYIFEVIKNLESTEVNQGKLTLDPMISPGVKKTERYFFTVEKGIIVRTKYEEEYER